MVRASARSPSVTQSGGSSSSIVASDGAGSCLEPARHRLGAAHDPQDVAAGDGADVIVGIAASEQLGEEAREAATRPRDRRGAARRRRSRCRSRHARRPSPRARWSMWSATCPIVAGAAGCSASQAPANVGAPRRRPPGASRSYASSWSMPGSTWRATSVGHEPDRNTAMTTPPLPGTRRRISSGTLRGWSVDR